MTETRPVVSVVMANHNGARHIESAMRSVLAQTVGQLELIVVDDASTDDSLAIVRRVAASDRRVMLLVEPQNLGPGAARNRALEAARGQWIAIVDSDDLLEPDRLVLLVDRARADGAQIVADNLMVFSDDGGFAPHPFLPPAGFAAPRWVTLTDYVRASVMFGPGPDYGFLKPLIAAEALEGLRYDESLRIGEDYDLMLRLLSRTGRLRIEPRALYRYRKHSSSISHRLKPHHLAQMLAAQARFRDGAGDLAPDLKTALAQRKRSLVKALAYERVVEGIKAGRLLPSLGRAAMSPGVWPLLARPVMARISRLVPARRQAGRVATRSA